MLKLDIDFFEASTRDIDFFGRVSGEEFAFLLLETDMSLALEIAERIRAGV